MNCLPEAKVFDGEIISADLSVTVLVNRHPFTLSHDTHHFAVGLSLQEMIEQAFPLYATAPLCCYIVGEHSEDVIPHVYWKSVRPKAGTTIVFKALAEGKMAKSLAMIGVAVLAIAAAILVPYLFGPLVIGSLTISATTLGTIAAGVITIAGSLAVQMLFPTPKKKLENTSTEEAVNTFSIQGAQNQARPFEAIPVILGRHRISPPYAGQPFTEFIGQDQYLTVVFCVGYGPVGHFDFQLGETSINNFSLDKFESYAGYAGDPSISFYPSDVHQEDLNIKLKGFVSNIRTTAPDTDYISIDLQAPEGIFVFYPETNIKGNIYIPFNIHYAPTGTQNFQPLILGWIPMSYGLNALRVGINFSLPRGQYDIMVTRMYSDSTDATNVKDATFWTALRSVTFESPIQFDAPISVIGMKIKATDQLSGVVDTFNLIAQSSSFAYTGSGWGTNYTSNPADLFRTVLQGPANKMPVPDSRLDLNSIEDWWRFCSAHGFTYNAVIESKRSVYEVLAEIAAAGRAVPTWKDGKWSVIWDNPNAPIVQHFTPRNSSDFKSERVYRKSPHGFRIRFINALNGYQQDEMIVYDDGYYVGNATIFEAVEFPGVTDPALIYKHGRYHIAQARLRPEIYSLSTDIEHLRCTRGDRVRVQHDIPMIGQVSGRIRSVDGTHVTLDETIAMEAGKDYVFRWRDAAGDSFVQGVINQEGEWTEIYFNQIGTYPSEGDLFMFGERGLETAVFRVFKIEHQGDFQARLTLVDDAPEIINADTSAIPEFNTHISDPVDPYSFPPRHLSVIEVIEGSGENATAFVRFSWMPARASFTVGYEAQIFDVDHPDLGWYGAQTVTVPQQFVDIHNILLGRYSFRVRAKFEDGTVSSWATLDYTRITQPHFTSPVADVINFRSAYVDGVTALRWDEVTDWRPVQYEIRRGVSWEAALYMGTFTQPPFSAHGLGTYWIAAVVKPLAGVVIYSPHPTQLIIGGSRLVDNVLATWDEKATGWPGIFTGSVGISGANIRTGGSTPFLNEPDFLGIPSLFDSGGTSNGNYYMPDEHTIDAGYVLRAQVTVDYDGTGDTTSGATGPVTLPLLDSDGNPVTDEDGLQVYVTTLPGDVAFDIPALDDDGNPILDSHGVPIVTHVPAGGFGAARSFLDVTDFLAQPDFLGAFNAKFVRVFPLIGVKDNIGDTWVWQKWQPGVYVGRYFTGAMVLQILTDQVSAYCLGFKFTVDVPDRIERYSGLAISALGTTLAFTPEGASAAAPYHGGPSGATLPNIQVTVLNSQVGDTIEITSKTLAGCNIRITNGGAGVARNCDLVIQGY